MAENPTVQTMMKEIDIQNKLAMIDQSIKERYGVSLFFINEETMMFNDRYIKKTDREWMSDFPMFGEVDEWEYQQGDGFRVVSYTIGLPAISPNSTAYLTIHLRQQAFADILNDIDFVDAADLHVLDPTLQPILSRTNYQVGTERTTIALDWIEQNPKMYDSWKDSSSDLSLQYVKSTITGWYTAYLVPLSLESGYISRIVWLTILVSLLAIATGVVLIYFNSRRLYAPMKNWLQEENFSSEGDHHDEWTWLRSRWTSLKEDLEKSEPELRRSFLITYIGSSYLKSRKDIETQFARYQIPQDRKSVIFIVDPGNYQDYNRFNADDDMLIHASMMNIFDELLTKYYLEGDAIRRPETYQTIFIVYFGQSMTMEQANQLTKQLAHALVMSIKTYMKFPVTLALGGIKPSVFELRDSYKEAKEALQYRIIMENESILDIHNIRMGNDRYQYPFDLSEQIVKHLRSADKENLEASFNQFVELVRHKHYSDQVYRQIYLMLYDATIQGFYQYSKEAVSNLLHRNGHEKILSAQFLSEIEQWFREEWFTLCLDMIESENEGKGKQVIEAVIQYINSSLQQDLSLQQVAEHVNLSASYLSRLFRKETGQNFVQYVATLKIEQAKKLLEHTDEPIYKIADAVGYTEQTFRRVFKNTVDMTPNEYRKSLRK